MRFFQSAVKKARKLLGRQPVVGHITDNVIREAARVLDQVSELNQECFDKASGKEKIKRKAEEQKQRIANDVNNAKRTTLAELEKNYQESLQQIQANNNIITINKQQLLQQRTTAIQQISFIKKVINQSKAGNITVALDFLYENKDSDFYKLFIKIGIQKLIALMFKQQDKEILALHLAIKYQLLEVIAELITVEADLFAKNTEVSKDLTGIELVYKTANPQLITLVESKYQEVYGVSIIQGLVLSGDAELLRKLHNNNSININASDPDMQLGQYVLTSNDKLAVAKALAELGYDFNQRDGNGFSVLHYCAAVNDLEFNNELIKLGAKLEITDLASYYATVQRAKQVLETQNQETATVEPQASDNEQFVTIDSITATGEQEVNKTLERLHQTIEQEYTDKQKILSDDLTQNHEYIKGLNAIKRTQEQNIIALEAAIDANLVNVDVQINATIEQKLQECADDEARIEKLSQEFSQEYAQRCGDINTSYNQQLYKANVAIDQWKNKASQRATRNLSITIVSMAAAGLVAPYISAHFGFATVMANGTIVATNMVACGAIEGATFATINSLATGQIKQLPMNVLKSAVCAGLIPYASDKVGGLVQGIKGVSELSAVQRAVIHGGVTGLVNTGVYKGKLLTNVISATGAKVIGAKFIEPLNLPSEIGSGLSGAIENGAKAAMNRESIQTAALRGGITASVSMAIANGLKEISNSLLETREQTITPINLAPAPAPLAKSSSSTSASGTTASSSTRQQELTKYWLDRAGLFADVFKAAKPTATTSLPPTSHSTTSTTPPKTTTNPNVTNKSIQQQKANLAVRALSSALDFIVPTASATEIQGVYDSSSKPDSQAATATKSWSERWKAAKAEVAANEEFNIQSKLDRDFCNFAVGALYGNGIVGVGKFAVDIVNSAVGVAETVIKTSIMVGKFEQVYNPENVADLFSDQTALTKEVEEFREKAGAILDYIAHNPVAVGTAIAQNIGHQIRDSVVNSYNDIVTNIEKGNYFEAGNSLGQLLFDVELTASGIVGVAAGGVQLASGVATLATKGIASLAESANLAKPFITFQRDLQIAKGAMEAKAAAQAAGALKASKVAGAEGLATMAMEARTAAQAKELVRVKPITLGVAEEQLTEVGLYTSEPLECARNNFRIVDKLESSLFTPTFDQIQSFSVKSALDGSFYPKEKLPILVNYLEKRGVHVYGTNAAPCFRGKKNGINHIYLPEHPTVLQVKHELSHWLDFKKLGFDKYSQLSTHQREKMVLDRLQNNRIWEDLNQFEKEFSLNYVEQFKSGHKFGVRYE